MQIHLTEPPGEGTDPLPLGVYLLLVLWNTFEVCSL
jgi:hypothetical protein